MSAQAESCEESNEDRARRGSSVGRTLIDSSTRGKENLDDNVPGKEKSNDEFVCHVCKRSLASSPELINIAGQPCRQWHPDCFKCIICREPMDKRQSCHVYEDQIVCRADYMRLKRDIISVKCARCRWPIGASDWVRKAAQHVYHLTCFNCDICSRQLNTGEQFIISPVDSVSEGGQSGGPVRLLCRLHFTIDHERRVPDQDIAIREHSGACKSAPPLKVARANQAQEEQNRLGGKCQQQSKRNFFCSQSAPSTSSGEGTSIIMAQPDRGSQEHSGFQFGPSMGKDLSVVTGHSQQHCPSSANTSPSATSLSNTTTLLGCDGSELGGPATPTGDQSGCGSGSGGSPSKSKRVRTTFTEDQLSILQTHFQIDSNPDGQDLERIATITGLSKRVTQVWFQNSRARQKKYMIKRKPMHAMASLQDHAHHTLELVGSGMGDEDEHDESSNHLRTFDELTRFHRRGELFAAGLEQLQRRCEVLNEQTSWRTGAGHEGGQVDEDRLSGISSLSSEADVTQGCSDDSKSPSTGKPEDAPTEGQSNN